METDRWLPQKSKPGLPSHSKPFFSPPPPRQPIASDRSIERKMSSQKTVLLVAAAVVVLLSLSARCARGQSGDDCQGQQTLASAIRGRDDTIFFARALDETGLSASLDGPGPYIVFAPIDAAFSSLESDPQVLELELIKLIQFHVAGATGLDEFESKKVRIPFPPQIHPPCPF